MKKAIFLIFICIQQNAYSQVIVKSSSQLDSLIKVKKEYKNIIAEYEIKINKIDLLMKEIEDKKLISEFDSFKNIDYLVPVNMNIKIRESDTPNSKVIYQPQGGETLRLLDFNSDSNYWFVSYNNVTGYVNDVYFQSTARVSEFKKFLVSRKEEKAKEKRQLELKKTQLEAQKVKEKQILMAQQREISLNKKYGSEVTHKIIAGKIWLGMTDEMTRESWGNPNNINRSVGSWGVHEQWVYHSSTYLYFENGILTSWQD